MKCGRWFLYSVFFFAAALAACGSSVTTVQPVTISPVALATPSYPIDDSTYTYASKTWGVFQQAGAAPQPIATAYGTQDESVTTGAAFNGRRDLIDVKTVFRSPSEVETSDGYLQWVPAALGQSLEKVGEVSSSKGSAGSGSSETTYTIPAPEVRVPFAAGSKWNAAAAFHSMGSGVTILEGVSIKSHSQESWNQDGSYARSGLNDGIIFAGQKNVHSTASLASDGSAISTSSLRGQSPAQLKIGVPIAGSSGEYVIPIDVLGRKSTIPDWYPGGALPPSPLVAAVIVDRGMKDLPMACDVPRKLAARGEAIVRTGSQFDPNGIVAATTDTAYYAPGIGMVCDVLSARSSDYDVFIPPAATLVGTVTFYTTTSLTRLTRKAGSLRSAVADELPYAVGAALSDTTRRRVRAKIESAMRAYPRRR